MQYVQAIATERHGRCEAVIRAAIVHASAPLLLEHNLASPYDDEAVNFIEFTAPDPVQRID
jgi:hypothetical protein